MKASICMATYNRPECLAKTLRSIYRQTTSFPFEVIVTDDGGDVSLDELHREFPQVLWGRVVREGGYRNSSAARNVSYRLASGEVIIAQSDDVMHGGEDCIEQLVQQLQPGTCVIGKVFNVDERGKYCFVMDRGGGERKKYGTSQLTSPWIRRPLFFLGSLWRSDLYAIGGNDEDFVIPAYEDKWFADCLIMGLRLQPIFSENIVGYHQDHPRPAAARHLSRGLLREKRRQATRTGQWVAAGGSWKMESS